MVREAIETILLIVVFVWYVKLMYELLFTDRRGH